MIRRLICTAALVVFAASFSSVASAQTSSGSWQNGFWVYPYKYFTNQQTNRRPMSDSERGMAISDYRIANVPMDAKGIQVTTTLLPNGMNRAYRWIAIWHCEISGVWRSGPGIHNDFIQVRGGGDKQDVPTTLLLQDINMHDGQGIPMMIQDAVFDSITLRDVRYSNTTTNIQISTINSGRIGTITIDHCPNVGVAIMGRPGTIGTVYVKNSPGIRISDVANKNGRSGCKFVYLN